MMSQVGHVSKDSSLATHTNLILLFKPALYYSTLVIKVVQSCFKPKFLLKHYRLVLYYKLRMARPLSKLKRSVLLVMYSCSNGFYYGMNG